MAGSIEIQPERVRVRCGGGSVAMTLRRAGLPERLQLEGGAGVFMDWSR